MDENRVSDYDEAGSRYVEAYCETLRVERNVSEHTLRAYRIDLYDYLRWAKRGSYDPIDLGHRQMRLYLSDLDRAQYSRTTVNRRLSSIRGFFRWLNATGVIEKDPASLLQGPKRAKNLPKVIKAADMVKLLSVHGRVDARGRVKELNPIEYRNQAILEYLYACGARVSEASGLITANVDFKRGQVKVFGKGSKERIIPLHEMALDSMQNYLRFARPKLLGEKSSDYFFVSTRGNQMGTDAIRKMFKETLREAGLDETLSPHDMRHTFATDLLDGGADLRSVQEMLGHVSLSTTQIYTHLSPSRLKDAHGKAHPRAGSSGR